MMNSHLTGALIFSFALVATSLQAAHEQNAVLAPHASDLVVLHGDKLVPFKESHHFLNAEYTILYFGAGWCSDCRKFSPGLVAAYKHPFLAGRPFEVLYIPQDRSEAEMRQFMIKEKMKWPALAYEKVGDAADLAKYHPKKSIPWLAVIDRAGNVLLHSESDKDAAEVLQRLEEKLKSKP